MYLLCVKRFLQEEDSGLSLNPQTGHDSAGWVQKICQEKDLLESSFSGSKDLSSWIHV